MKARGRPVLGAIAGFFLFLFIGLDLLLFGVIPANSAALTILPVVGIVVGLVWGYLAPLGPRRPPPRPAVVPEVPVPEAPVEPEV